MFDYRVTYSYPTTDRYYRGQMTLRIRATSEIGARQQVKKQFGPDIKIVRCQEIQPR